MGKAERRKGHDFERLVAKALRGLGIGAQRGLQSRSGSLVPDVEITDSGLDHLWIECKTGKRPSVWAAMDQASDAAGDGYAPVVIAHRDRGRTLVCMELDDWLEFLSSHMYLKETAL